MVLSYVRWVPPSRGGLSATTGSSDSERVYRAHQIKGIVNNPKLLREEERESTTWVSLSIFVLGMNSLKSCEMMMNSGCGSECTTYY